MAPRARPAWHRRHAATLRLSLALLLGMALASALLLHYGPPGTRALTQQDIDRAVLHTLETKPLPSPAAKAFEAVRGSVVKVIGTMGPRSADKSGAKPGSEKKILLSKYGELK